MKPTPSLWLFLLAAVPLLAAGAPPDPYATIRGMTVSDPGVGEIWGSDAMVETMKELKAMGVNWITIHPYGGIRCNGQVGSSRIDDLYRDPTWLTRPVEEAHRLGLKILIKPHLAYWGTGWAWRGEITFDTEEQWDRFFTSYKEWITLVVQLSADADAFCVGTELDQTAYHLEEWREIIAAVRAETDAPLTYSAGWDTYEKIHFWDDLDAIGIQAYFPLVSHAGVPDEAELDRAWAAHMETLSAFSEHWGRDVVFTELGYNRSKDAARTPWTYGTGGADAELIQQRCLAAALRALDRSEHVSGAFLWKWFPGNARSENFLKSTPAMRAVIADHWGEGRS